MDAESVEPREHRARRRYLLPASTVGAIAIGLAVFLATRSAPSGVVAGSALAGRIAPPIAGRSLIGDKPIDLASYRGRYVVVDFFASWCSTCLSEAPNLAAFAFQHRKDRSIALLGVDIEDSPGAGAAFLRETGAGWPAIEDTNGANSIALAYGVSSPPQIWIVSPKGLLVARAFGDPSAAALDAAIGKANPQ